MAHHRSLKLLALLALAGLLLGLGWSRPAMAQGSAPLRVVASFSILADWVREVGGPQVEVHSLVPAGADAHVFVPTPADARRLARAELVVVNGLRYEGWIDRLVQVAGYRGPVLVATRGIVPRRSDGGADPHAWQSLGNARRYVENIRAALVAARPADAGLFDARARDYTRRLDALDKATRLRIAAVPAERRRVITGHDAFGYFADAHGIRFIAPRGWSTDSEPSAESVARIVRQVRQQQASALLVENLSDPRLLERIAREAGVRVGGRLYADALSAPGSEADSYLKLYSHNVDTLLAAMAPPPGLAAAAGQRATHSHEHGLARLDVVAEAQQLHIRLEAPLDTLVGFEHPPRTTTERRRADAALATVRAADRLFAMDPAAGCTLDGVEIDSPTLALAGPGQPEAGGQGHAELAADIRFECRDAGKLSFIEVGLFKAFPRLLRLEVQAVTQTRQIKRRLSPKATRLSLSPP